MLNASSSTSAAVTLAVLAGGAGVRMGRPKGLLEIQGEPILVWLLDQLKWPGPTLLVMSPGRDVPEGADRFDTIAWDSVSNEGPLRGLLTAIENASTPLVIVIPVDMPGLASPPLSWLADKLSAQADLAAVMTSRVAETAHSAQIEPMPLALRRSIAQPILAERLRTNHRSLQGLADDKAVIVVPAPADWPARFWCNLNEPADLQKFLSETTKPGSYDSVVDKVNP